MAASSSSEGVAVFFVISCDENRSDRDETHIVKKSFNVSTDDIGDFFLYLRQVKCKEKLYIYVNLYYLCH